MPTLWSMDDTRWRWTFLSAAMSSFVVWFVSLVNRVLIPYYQQTYWTSTGHGTQLLIVDSSGGMLFLGMLRTLGGVSSAILGVVLVVGWCPQEVVEG